MPQQGQVRVTVANHSLGWVLGDVRSDVEVCAVNRVKQQTVSTPSGMLDAVSPLPRNDPRYMAGYAAGADAGRVAGRRDVRETNERELHLQYLIGYDEGGQAALDDLVNLELQDLASALRRLTELQMLVDAVVTAQRRLVAIARAEQGASWSDIGDALLTSKQAAWERFSGRRPIRARSPVTSRSVGPPR